MRHRILLILLIACVLAAAVAAHARMSVHTGIKITDAARNGSGCSGVNLLPTGDLSGGAWFQANGSLTVNTVTGPTGATDGATFVEASDVAQRHEIETGFNIVKPAAPTVYTFQTAAAPLGAGSARNAQLFISSGAGSSGVFANFNPSTGAVVTAAAAYGSGWTALGSGVVAASGGWFRFYVTVLTNSDADVFVADTVASATNATYNGDGASGLKLAQAMFAADSGICPYVPPANVAPSLNFGIAANSMYIPLLGGFR